MTDNDPNHELQNPNVDGNLLAQYNLGGFIAMVRYFSGDPATTTIKEFLSSIRTASALGSWSPEQQLAVFRARLVGPALQYLRACDFPEDVTWDTVRHRFNTWYRDTPPLLDPIHSFYQSSQRTSETAKGFVTRLKIAGIMAVNHGIDAADKAARQTLIDSGILSVFINGLRDDSGSTFLLMNSPDDLDAAVISATRYEAKIRPRKHACPVTSNVSFSPSPSPQHAPRNSRPPQDAPLPSPPPQQRPPRAQRPAPPESVPSPVVDPRLGTLIQTLDNLIKTIATSYLTPPSPRPLVQRTPGPRIPAQRTASDSDLAPVLCYRCGQLGHYAPHCRAPTDPARQSLRCDHCRTNGHSSEECRRGPTPNSQGPTFRPRPQSSSPHNERRPNFGRR